MEIVERPFTVEFDSHCIKGDTLSLGGNPIQLVLLHGAGLGTRERYRDFRLGLARAGIGSLAFDFVGFGETGGDIGGSSLQSRTEQACAVFEAMNMRPPISLLGSSMGAYTAVKLIEIYSITNIVLFVPAMYNIAAYSVPFGAEFTRIIRQPNSWVASDAWQILRSFRGRLLLVTGGTDDVIPQDVIHRIYESAVNTSRREICQVEQSPHLLIHYLSQHEAENERVMKLVRQYVESTDNQESHHEWASKGNGSSQASR